MNIPPSEAKKLSLEEYEEILWNWNEAQVRENEREVDATEAKSTLALLDRINADPRLIH